jgi:hypothetical protein
MAKVAFQTEVVPIVVEVRRCLCASNMFADVLRCHVAERGSSPFDFHEPIPGVVLSQPSPGHARETQHPASSFFGLWREES